MTFTVFGKFSKWLFVLHILAYSKFELRWFSAWEPFWTLFKSSFPTLRTVWIWDLQCFQSFRNCCLFCTFWHFRNFYSGEAHHANYSKHSLNDHFQRCAHWVYEIYSIFQVFEIPVYFAHIGIFELSTPVRRIMLTMANIVQIIISNIAHSVYMRFTVFSKFSKLLFVLHILAYSKFLFRCAHYANYDKHSLNHHFQDCAHSVYQIYSLMKLFVIAVSFANFAFCGISTLVMRIILTMANIVEMIISNIAHTVYIRF